MLFNNKLVSIFITFFFFKAGINKIKDFKKTVDGFKKKVPLLKNNTFISSIIIASVVLLEIIAPLLIVFSSFTNKNKNIAKICCYGLIIFTVLATLLYHPTNFASNLSVIGGLILLSNIFEN